MDQKIDQQNQGQPNQMPRLSKRVILSGLIVLILIIAGAALLNARYNKQRTTNTEPDGQVVDRITDRIPPQYVSDGQVVEGFPEAFLAGSTSIQKSYKKDYSSETKLFTTEFTLNKTEKEAFDFYTKYLTDNNYDIQSSTLAGSGSSGPATSSLYGTAENGDQVSILIAKSASVNSNDVTVIIAFNPKAK